MRRMLATALVTFGLIGCGTDGDDPRLQVSDAVRQACGDYFGGDEDLRDLLREIDNDRLGGISYDDEKNYWVFGEGCCYLVSGSSCSQCSTCMRAIIDQIYDR